VTWGAWVAVGFYGVWFKVCGALCVCVGGCLTERRPHTLLLPILLLLLLLQVLTCSWCGPSQQPAVMSSSVAFSGAAVSVLGSSWSGAYRLLGTADGQVRLEETGGAAGATRWVGRNLTC